MIVEDVDFSFVPEHTQLHCSLLMIDEKKNNRTKSLNKPEESVIFDVDPADMTTDIEMPQNLNDSNFIFNIEDHQDCVFDSDSNSEEAIQDFDEEKLIDCAKQDICSDLSSKCRILKEHTTSFVCDTVSDNYSWEYFDRSVNYLETTKKRIGLGRKRGWTRNRIKGICKQKIKDIIDLGSKKRVTGKMYKQKIRRAIHNQQKKPWLRESYLKMKVKRGYKKFLTRDYDTLGLPIDDVKEVYECLSALISKVVRRSNRATINKTNQKSQTCKRRRFGKNIRSKREYDAMELPEADVSDVHKCLLDIVDKVVQHAQVVHSSVTVSSDLIGKTLPIRNDDWKRTKELRETVCGELKIPLKPVDLAEPVSTSISPLRIVTSNQAGGMLETTNLCNCFRSAENTAHCLSDSKLHQVSRLH